MADQTVHAEALLQAVARAFYDDDIVCLIDVLIRDKYLRDDDMGQRLSLPARKLRVTMQFLQEEHLVKYELVDDLRSGGSQNTKYWYIDFHHAVNVIRLRIYLLKKKLDEDELRARSNSMYLCPGYKSKVCNGRYTESEAQQIVDLETGHFFCQECFANHKNNPEPPSKCTYTLQLLDNAQDLKEAQENIRRVRVQLHSKMIGNLQLRVGIYDLLQKVRRTKGKNGILSSNLPSENIEKDIGTKRIEGTGRTAGIKKKRDKLLEGARRTEEGSDVNFLKNRKGEEIGFEVEKGGGARANLLATMTKRRSKLMDAAASRVGAGTPPPIDDIKNDSTNSNNGGNGNTTNANTNSKKPQRNLPGLPFFLRGNIEGDTIDHVVQNDNNHHSNNNSNNNNNNNNKRDFQTMTLNSANGGTHRNNNRHTSLPTTEEEYDDWESQRNMTDEQRRAHFQALYKLELNRQKQLYLQNMHNGTIDNGKDEEEDRSYANILWVEG